MIDFPVGSIIASDNMAYIKKKRGKKPYDYEEYWIGAEGFGFPIYTDAYANTLIKEGHFKVVRMGTDG